MCFDMCWSKRKINKGILVLVLRRAGGMIVLKENELGNVIAVREEDKIEECGVKAG